MNFRIVLMPLFRSDTVFFFCIPCAVSVAAQGMAADRIDLTNAMLETAVAPEYTCSPTLWRTVRDSPVSMDSSSSSPQV